MTMKGLLSWGVLTHLLLLDSHAAPAHATAPHSPHSHSATVPHSRGRSTGLGAGAVAVMSVTTESDAYVHNGITFVGHPTPMLLMTSRRWHHANDDLEATAGPQSLQTHTRPSTRAHGGATATATLRQTAYRVVATNAITDRPLWDSGWVQSSAQAVQWPSSSSTTTHRLTSNTRVDWTVTVRDGSGAPSTPSRTATFQTALIAADGWNGSMWIAQSNTVPTDDCAYYKPSPAPKLRTEYSMPSDGVAMATAHVIGLGYYRLYINGERVGDHELDPSLTSYNRTLLYSSYDVTAMVAASSNSSVAIGIELGNGWWNQLPFNLFGTFNFRETMTVGTPRARLVVNVQFDSGREVEIVTHADEGAKAATQTLPHARPAGYAWSCASVGPLTHTNVYLGQAYNATAEVVEAGWSAPGFAALNPVGARLWQPCLIADDTAAVVVENSSGWTPPTPRFQAAPPVRATAAWRPIRAWEVPPTIHADSPPAFVLDFGQELTGWVNFSMSSRGRRGGSVTLVFAERLNGTSSATSVDDIDPTSTFFGGMGRWCAPGSGCESMWGKCAFDYPPEGRQSGEQAVVYTMRGDLGEAYAGSFSFHVFRYVRVTGYPFVAGGVLPLDDFVAVRLHTDNKPVGGGRDGGGDPRQHQRTQPAPSFESSSELLNKIDALSAASFRSNWIGIQSDCPGRERLGYGGDMMTSAEAGMYMFDSAAFYTKRAMDYADARRANGGLPETAPYVGIATCDVMGDGSGPMQWGAGMIFTLHMLYMHTGSTTAATEHWDVAVEWMDLLEQNSVGGILESALRGFAEPKGSSCRGSEVKLMGTAFLFQQSTLMAELATAIGDEKAAIHYGHLANTTYGFFNANFFSVTNGTYGEYPDDMVYALGLGLVPANRRQSTVQALLDSRVNTTNFVVDAFGAWLIGDLVPYGCGEEIMDWMLSTTAPSYGYFLHNSVVNATSMMEHWDTPEENDSHNHAWLNSVSLFYRRVLLGIAPTSPGFSAVRVQPWPLGGGRLSWAKGHVDTVLGVVAVGWLLGEARGDGTTMFHMNVSTPIGSHCTVHVPAAARGTRVDACPNAHFVSSYERGGLWWHEFDIVDDITCTFESAFLNMSPAHHRAT